MGLVTDVLAVLRGGATPAGAVEIEDQEGREPGFVAVDLGRPDGRPTPVGILAVVDRMADTIAEAVVGLPAGEEIPDGWMMDAAGRLVRLANVREADRLQDEVARSLALEGLLLHELLKDYKARSLGDMADLAATVAKEYQAVIGGKRGNMTLTTFDGLWKVQRTYRDVISFGVEIQAAKQLVGECFEAWVARLRANGGGPEVDAIVGNIEAVIDRAFVANKKGDLRTGPVLELLRTEIDDPRWQTAMDALSESIEVSGSAVYVRVYRRGEADQYLPIPIDLASV
ncbi:DUF3164 family protein [uncultured Thiodictyon sp.]|uniref:DUF3164 family protein n=1 Tax=uncultured Thiodictyon sp. TaxID=1846217 RepID=UPI0025D72DCA|nr:DUF3164 family protein [uncultured Thiodictyon sp.]